jgi:DNA-directed RNA polymerase specialized sigma24 family protein
MRPSADRYTPDDTAERPTSSAGSGFAEAYRAHCPALVKLAAFIVGDQATGEDVVQDVFTRLHLSRSWSSGPRSRSSTWLLNAPAPPR